MREACGQASAVESYMTHLHMNKDKPAGSASGADPATHSNGIPKSVKTIDDLRTFLHTKRGFGAVVNGA